MKKAIDFLLDKYNFCSTINIILLFFSFICLLREEYKSRACTPFSGLVHQYEFYFIPGFIFLLISIWCFWTAIRIYNLKPNSMFIIFFIIFGILYCPFTYLSIVPSGNFICIFYCMFIILFTYHFKFFKNIFCKVHDAIKYEQRG